MDLSFGPEYEAFREEVRTFIEANRDKAPRGGGRGEGRSKQAQVWQKLLIQHGYTARTIPKEYGGYGAEPDIIKSRIIAEEFAEGQIPGGMHFKRCCRFVK